MQIGKSITSEDLWRLWEDREWRFKRPHAIYSGRNSVPKFWGKLFEDEDLKMMRIGETGSGKLHHASWAHGMRLGHGKCKPCTLGILHAPWAYPKLHSMRLGHMPCVLGILNIMGACVILCVCGFINSEKKTSGGILCVILFFSKSISLIY